MSVNSENPLHSSFRENYEYGFALVMFKSASGPDCRFVSSVKHLLANVIIYEVQC